MTDRDRREEGSAQSALIESRIFAPGTGSAAIVTAPKATVLGGCRRVP